MSKVCPPSTLRACRHHLCHRWNPKRITQDRPTFETEAALIASLATSIIRITPSRAEAELTPTDAVVLPATDLPEVLETKLPPGGRGRGLVLHKLIEEALTGEAAEDAAELTKRAGELLATCEMDTSGSDPAELAATVLRTLALPEIAGIRPRLVPELAVHASFAVEGEEQVVSGIADAVALAPDGNIEVVVDWKSDVAPTAQTVDGLSKPSPRLHPSDGGSARANRSDDIWNGARSSEMSTRHGRSSARAFNDGAAGIPRQHAHRSVNSWG